MRITEAKTNIFVLGDLVLDHAIFVRPKTRPYETVGNEKVSDVFRRIDTAGGAANCARTLACLSHGRTFLWGVTGRSPWGAFSAVLDRSQIYDSADNRVLFRGHHDEGINMNTSTRVIVQVNDKQEHEHQFDDIGSVSLTDASIKDALNHVRQAHEEAPLHAIVVNDLDMNAVRQSLISELATFAIEERIPLFLDPKGVPAKYAGISATAIVPNLKEWCELVGQTGKDDTWRHMLGNRTGVEALARYSIEHLPNFDHHIIKCDKDGAVLIGPSAASPHRFVVYHIPPHPVEGNHDLPHQLGCGDVITAILALEYASLDPRGSSIGRMLRAYHTANGVVAYYRQNPWNRVPTRLEVARLRTPSPKVAEEGSITAPGRYLPKGDTITLRKALTAVPGLLSVDKDYMTAIADLIGFLSSGWTLDAVQSAILTARGGSGKSEICKQLPDILGTSNVGFCSLDKEIEACRGLRQAQTVIADLRSKCATPGLVVAIDEAVARAGRFLRGKNGVILLEEAHRQKVRFLLIDADFRKFERELSRSQFLSRCRVFHLPPIARRPVDIPYIFAAGCLAEARQKDLRPVVCDEEVLLALIAVTLEAPERNQSARVLSQLGSEAFRKASERLSARTTEVHVKIAHLRPGYIPARPPRSPSAPRKLLFEE